MQSINPVTECSLQDIRDDLEKYLSSLVDLNKDCQQVLFDLYEQYLINGPKRYFGFVQKYSFEQFLSAIVFNSKLVFYQSGQHYVPFEHVRPETYTYNIKNKKLAKLCVLELDQDLLDKIRLIKITCYEMFYLTCITESYSTIQLIDKYKTNFMVDRRIANLHSHALISTERMKLLRK